MFEVIRDIPYLRKNYELCQPPDAIDEDFRFDALPSRERTAADDDVDAAQPSEGGSENPPPVLVFIEDFSDEWEELNPRRNLREEAMSLNHLLTQTPFNIDCDACNLGKMREAKNFVGSYVPSK